MMSILGEFFDLVLVLVGIDDLDVYLYVLFILMLKCYWKFGVFEKNWCGGFYREFEVLCFCEGELV